MSRNFCELQNFVRLFFFCFFELKGSSAFLSPGSWTFVVFAGCFARTYWFWVNQWRVLCRFF